MSIQPVTVLNVSRDRRNLNTVQRTLRAMMWLVIFAILVSGTLILSFVLGLVRSTPLSIVVLAVGGFLSLILPGMITRCLYVTPEFQRIVVLRLGKFAGVKGPGMFWVIPYPPFYQSVAAELDIRVQTRVITASQTLTRDNVPVGCEAVVFWRVEDPRKAALEVADYGEAVFQAANSALKDTVGSMELTDLLSEREKVAHQLKDIIDSAAAKFGVDVSSVEITDIHVPADLIQELSVIAQSRRSAQAKIAEADVEVEVAERLQQAAEIMGAGAMEMYRLGVLERIGREEGSQIVVYGLGATDAAMERTMASTAAGSLAGRGLQKKPGVASTNEAPGRADPYSG
jgi:regulator of protease activity HflC (stomatin/prohibitin superfamily)